MRFIFLYIRTFISITHHRQNTDFWGLLQTYSIRICRGKSQPSVFLARTLKFERYYPLQYSCLANHMNRRACRQWGCNESDTTELLTHIIVHHSLFWHILFFFYIKVSLTVMYHWIFLLSLSCLIKYNENAVVLSQSNLTKFLKSNLEFNWNCLISA